MLAALSFLEVEERRGRVNLDVTEFRYVVSRFSELGGLDTDEVLVLPPSRFVILRVLCSQRSRACICIVLQMGCMQLAWSRHWLRSSHSRC